MTIPFEQIKARVRLSEIISREVKLVREGGEMVGLCPFHEERSPSFKIPDDKDFYHCFGCGAHGDVFDWLEKRRGMSRSEAAAYLEPSLLNVEIKKPAEILPKPVMPIPAGKYPNTNHQFLGEPNMVHVYRDMGGNPLYYICRYEADELKKRSKKVFQPYYWGDNKQWINRAIEDNRPLFGLENLHRSPGEAIVILVEGEKCAEQLQAMIPERAVITWSGGVNAIEKTDWTPLKDRRVIYWYDNDANGKKSIDEIVNLVGELYIVNLPSPLPTKWDCGSAIRDGWTKEQLIGLINNRIRVHPKQEDETTTEANFLDQTDDQEDRIEFPPHLLEEVPGLVGEIAGWINKASIRDQPLFAIAGALSATGLIYAHKYRTETNLRSNIYTLGVGLTGSGKDFCLVFIKDLFNRIGIRKAITSAPPSHQSVRTSLFKRQGKMLTLIDEFGKFLRTLKHRNTSSHEAGVSTIYTELYSSAQSYLPAQERADYDGKTQIFDLEQPCLSILALTSPDHLYNALSSIDAEDGFLPRWLLFVAENNDPVPHAPEILLDALPEDFLNKMRKMVAPPETVNDAITPNPKVIPFSEGAKSLRIKFADECMNYRVSDKSGRAFWARAEAHADKIALCCHEGEEISEKVMAWAIEVARYCTKKVCQELETHMAENEQESITKRVLKIIREHKTISKRDLTRKTKWLSTRVRDEIVNTLVETKEIYIDLQKKSERETTYYRYIPSKRKPFSKESSL